MDSVMMTTQPSLGASSFAPDPNDPFFLSTGDWRLIQRYVITGSAMPTDDVSLRSLLGVPVTTDVTAVTDIVPVTSDVAAHCTAWQTTTYPLLVTLAGNLVSYGEGAPLYYGALQTELNKAAAGGSDGAAARVNAGKILDKLASEADGYAARAQAAFDAVNTFKTQSEADDQRVGTLRAQYDKRFADNGPELTKLQNDIDAAQRELEAAQAEYEHDVIVAATSVTYAWIVPFGTIAAVTVATVYGVRATKAKETAAADAAKLKLLQDDQKTKQGAYALVKIVDSKVGDLGDKLKAALPILQRLTGTWQSLRDRMTTLATTVRQNIPLDDAFMASLGIQDSIQQWQKLARTANNFVANAYVIGQSPDNPLPLAAVAAISAGAANGIKLRRAA